MNQSGKDLILSSYGEEPRNLENVAKEFYIVEDGHIAGVLTWDNHIYHSN